MSTHKKIAQLAGVSLSTVSKALSGSAEISATTREKIIQIAEETGYFKKKNQRKLEYSKHRTLNIALICPEIISIHYSTTLTTIKNEIEKRGGTTFIYTSDFNQDKIANIIKQLTLSGFIDGIIISDPKTFVYDTSLPIVLISSKDNAPYDTVGVSMKDFFYNMVLYLKNNGHKDIGFAGELRTKTSEEEFRFAMDRLNLKVNENFIYISEKRFEDAGIEMADSIIKQNSKPTAVITAYAEIGLGLIHELINKGISVPDDISVIARNNIPSCEYAQVPLTCFDLFDQEVALAATELLYDKIFKNTNAVKHVVINYQLIERNSVKAINTK